MKLIDISKQLEEIIVKNDLDKLPKDLRSEELEKNLSLIYEKDRVLKIGIVGRVKAGKSSLLNALVFDGKDILPKAATPMTAALTRLEYGEVIEANVDFYTQEDIDSLKKNFDKYKEEFEKLKKQKFEELKNTQQRKLQVEILDESTKQEILQKAENIANREMKDKEELFSSYDQYSKIKASNLSLAELKEFENIQADNIDSLNKKLYDFVGADGEYMPFTKSVNIKLNDENLKDIEIIDTPGINDPISSREARTEDLLQECDVIFIVSPSGQFLSNEDMNLLDRITTKDGIQEIHIVASQIDNQLYGSEKENNNGILPKVLESLKQNLTKQIRNVLGDKKNQFEAKIYEKFMKNDVLYSSGATYSMLQRFEDKENWDANLEHIWKNLNEKYKDYFSDDESAKANLSLLANMKNIQSTLDEVRKEKAEIIKKRQDDVVKVKLNSLEEYHKTMINDIQQKIEKIKSSDIEDIKNKIDSSSKIRIEASETVNWEYEDYIEEFSIDLKNALNNQIKKDFNDSKNNIDDSQEIELESYTYDYGFFSWKFGSDRYEERYDEVFTIKAKDVRNDLKKLTSKIEELIFEESEDRIRIFKKNTYKRVLPVLREKAGDKNLDLHQIQRSIRNSVNSIEYPEISYTDIFPNSLNKGGKLKEDEAREFVEEAEKYVSDFEKTVKKDIKNYLSSLEKVLKSQNLGENIFSDYIKKIEELENDLKNKELSLAINDYILKQLESVKW